MVKDKKSLDSIEFTNLLVDTVEDKKASDILLLDMKEHSLFADYFLLCSAESDRQIKAIVNTIKEDAKQVAGEIPIGVEGKPEEGWVLVDYGHVVCHVFLPERREYYDLEELWHEARVVIKMD